MKKIMSIFFGLVMMLVLSSCGKQEVLITQRGADGIDGTSCIFTQLDEGVLIQCNDGTEVIVYHGQDGIDGLDGNDGQDGIDGQDGTDGQDGSDGTDGLSCTVTQEEECAVISCEDGTSAEVCPLECTCESTNPHCNNGNGNGGEGCDASDNGNDDEDDCDD